MSGLRLFISQFWKQYHTTGAIWPSGKALARELAYCIRENVSHAQSSSPGAQQNAPQTNRRLLEVGPGTGTLTTAIIAAMQPTDMLTLVEVNPEFVQHLQQRLNNEPAWQAVAPRTTIVTKLIQDFTEFEPFDHLVSGLPLNNFSVETVSTILGCFNRLVRLGGTVSFFEYVAMRKMKAVVSRPKDYERLRGIASEIGQFLQGREFRCHAVWRNLPPAWAHHVRLNLLQT